MMSLARLPKLESLKFFNTPSVTGEFLGHLKSLKSIEFTIGNMSDNSIFVTIAENCLELEVLKIRDCEFLSNFVKTVIYMQIEL